MDFLTFKTFISIKALIVFYYMGAIIMPIGIWWTIVIIVKKYNLIQDIYQQGKRLLWQSLSNDQRLKIASLFAVSFLFMELLWRMMFEFLIAYMQIRDALLQPSL